jgi:hypothetical protein
MLARRSISDPACLAFYHCYATRPAGLPELVKEASNPSAKVGCVITIDDVPVAVERPRKGSAYCMGDFPPDDEGAPPSAQPAVFGF